MTTIIDQNTLIDYSTPEGQTILRRSTSSWLRVAESILSSGADPKTAILRADESDESDDSDAWLLGTENGEVRTHATTIGEMTITRTIDRRLAGKL